MGFIKQAPEWRAVGIEPPESKRNIGWEVEDRPPAAWLNWFMNLTAESLQELQSKAAEKTYVEDKIAEAIAGVDVDIPDASLTVKGITQLNSAVDSTSETQAATPKAVKSVNDTVVSHKAEQATLTTNGHVQLSSSITTASETEAATSKAIKIVNDALVLHKTQYATDALKSVQKTTSPIYYWVAPTGNDVTGDGTSLKPFKTIQYALNKLPKVLDHQATITVTGGSYPEIIYIQGFVGSGSIVLTGALTLATTHSVTAILIQQCGILVRVEGFNITTTTQTGLRIDGCAITRVTYINVVGAAVGFSGAEVSHSLCNIWLSRFSNRSVGVLAQYGSVVSCASNTGTGNKVGLTASYGGTIAKYGESVAGTTAEFVESGGVIR